MDLTLRPCVPGDAEDVFRWRNERTTVLYNPVDPLTLEELRERFAVGCADLGNGVATDFRWMVLLSGEPVGTVSLKGVNRRMGYAEVGYGLGEAFQGRGVGTEVVALFTRKVFAETNLRKLFAYVSSENVASWKLLERNGWQREGCLRAHYRIQDRFHDELIYAVFRP
jgi:[ribosomal protein S5]-alanine N-acetyltransferase